MLGFLVQKKGTVLGKLGHSLPHNLLSGRVGAQEQQRTAGIRGSPQLLASNHLLAEKQAEHPPHPVFIDVPFLKLSPAK